MANLRRPAGSSRTLPPPLRSLTPSDPASRAADILPNAPLLGHPDERGARGTHVYLTHKEAADYLRVSVRTLHYLVERREVTPGYVGRRRRYAVATLDAYVRATATARSRARLGL